MYTSIDSQKIIGRKSRESRNLKVRGPRAGTRTRHLRPVRSSRLYCLPGFRPRPESAEGNVPRQKEFRDAKAATFDVSEHGPDQEIIELRNPAGPRLESKSSVMLRLPD